jgi:type I restriction enzyme R subunit
MQPTTANFGFLKPHGPQLYRLAVWGESYFRTDPNTTLIKMRQFAELLSKEVAARSGLLSSPDSAFNEVLGRASKLIWSRTMSHMRKPRHSCCSIPGSLAVST